MINPHSKFNFIVILFLFLFNSTATFGQVQFDKHLLIEGYLSSTSTPHIGHQLKMADIDGDGFDDVVVAGGEICWYENINGQGQFGNQNLIDKVPGIISLDIVDMNGDGFLDVLLASEQTESIFWYKNLGEGTFSSSLNYVDWALDDLTNAVAADLDGDGDQDVIFCSSSDDRIDWLENIDGTDDFSNPQPIFIFPQNGPKDIKFADFDGNGTMDIAVGGGDNYVYYNDGSANFTRELLGTIINGSNDYIIIDDYDQDGMVDIISGGSGVVLHKNLQGSFDSPQLVYEGPSEFIASGDIDMDGDIDIGVVQKTMKSVIWLENQDPNELAIIHPILEDIGFPHGIVMNDHDYDGDQDIIFTLPLGILPILSNADGKGEFVRVDDVNSEIEGLQDMISIDLDKDGDLDIIAAHHDRIDWLENVDGDAKSMDQHNITYEIQDVRIAIGDIDNDGDEDIVSYSLGSDVKWFENINGLGEFSDPISITDNYIGEGGIDVLDVDNDGLLDIIGYNSYSIRWLRNIDGSGNFEAEKDLYQYPLFTLNKLSFHDLDGDKDEDMILIASTGSGIFWSENLDGIGDFSSIRLLTNDLYRLVGVEPVDVDGDLDIDLVYVGQEEIGWFENTDGIGTFEERQTIFEVKFPQKNLRGMACGDFDGDGDKDITAISDESFYWCENHGYASGRWSTLMQVDSGFYGFCVSDDYNGNGIDDVLVYSSSRHSLFLFSNNSEPQSYIVGNVNFNVIDSCTIENPKVADILVTSSNGNETYSSFTNKNGRFLNKVPLGSYNTSVTELPTNTVVYPQEIVSNITEGNKVDSIMFCLMTEGNDSVESLIDLMISVIPVSEFRPGFDATCQIIFKNIGNTNISDSISLSFQSSKADFISATLMPENVSGNRILWKFEDLNPFETRKINVKFKVKPPPTITLASILKFVAEIYPLSNDISPNNNNNVLNQLVVGSFDPNDIAVLEGSAIEYLDYLNPDTLNYLNYVIRFQNTGTASAIDVRIANILDHNLDWTTFEPISTSHANRIEIVNQDSVNFVFDGIYLPDSTTDVEGSQGFVAYRVKIKDGLTLGDVIKNDAEIYFDFNEPIITNEVITELVDIVGTSDTELPETLFIHPNPSRQVSFIGKIGDIFNILVYDQNGRLIKKINNSRKIDLVNQEAGLYFIKVKSRTGNIYMLKFVKI